MVKSVNTNRESPLMRPPLLLTSKEAQVRKVTDQNVKTVSKPFEKDRYREGANLKPTATVTVLSTEFERSTSSASKQQRRSTKERQSVSGR